jgi:3-oxoacyl-[acyl-carrier protein] reductase
VVDMKNQVAFVTGCTRGIGLATMKDFLERGACVYGLYKSNDTQAQEAAQALDHHRGRFLLKKAGIEHQDTITARVEEAAATFGSIDIVVNNAGIADDSLLLHMSDDQWNRVMLTNFHGTVHVINAALPFMLRQKRGKIVNVVSISALFGKESQINYSSSKGAVIGLTRMIARLHGKDGISCNAIAPGFVETDMLASIPHEVIQSFIEHSSRRRLVKPDEIARVIAFLSSSLSDAFNGSVLDSDGGFLK